MCNLTSFYPLSHSALQAGPQVQTRDQAGEEGEAAGPGWAEGCWQGRHPHQETPCAACWWDTPNINIIHINIIHINVVEQRPHCSDVLNFFTWKKTNEANINFRTLSIGRGVSCRRL